MSEEAQWTSTGMAGFSENGPIPESDEWDFGVGSVTGYRWWWWHVNPAFAGYHDPDFKDDNAFSYLIGAYRGEWEPGKLEAECRSSSWFRFDQIDQGTQHNSPANGCGCGFWAYFDQGLKSSKVLGVWDHRTEPLIVSETYFDRRQTVRLPVLGVVEGTGRTVIGETGFRSQYARIKALCLPEEAVARLSYDVTRINSYAHPLESNEALRDHIRDNPRGSVMNDHGYTWKYESASELDLALRISVAEEILSELYPDAKILPTREAMMKQFPPDKYYGENSG